MNTQEKYWNEIRGNLYKFQNNKDDYIKRRLRKLTTTNLKYVNSVFKRVSSNLTGRPSEIASTTVFYERIIKYIDFLIKKREGK